MTDAKKTPAPKPVSPQRLHQKSGADNAFGGYTKVRKPDGSFTMKKSSK